MQTVSIETTAVSQAPAATRVARLFFLEPGSDRIHAMNADGSNRSTIVSHCHIPDGIVVDEQAGHIYWTNMGIPGLGDGSIERADLNGKHRAIIVPAGVTHTPKQIHLDKAGGKLYWCDREGMRVMRANLDGSQVETLIETGRGAEDARDETRWCVGITVDPQRRMIYWSQKGPTKGGVGRIFRASVDIPKGEIPTNRSDIELLWDRLPEPIDLELDLVNRTLYWTDRGAPPRGNTVNRAPIDRKGTPEVLITQLAEGIGVALDVPNNRMFITDLGGTVYSAGLDGKGERAVATAQGILTGIAYAEISSTSEK